MGREGQHLRCHPESNFRGTTQRAARRESHAAVLSQCAIQPPSLRLRWADSRCDGSVETDAPTEIFFAERAADEGARSAAIGRAEASGQRRTAPCALREGGGGGWQGEPGGSL